MERTQIMLEKETKEFLALIAKQEGKSIAKIIREVLQEGLRSKTKNLGLSLANILQDAGTSGIGNLAKDHDKYLYQSRP